MLIFFFFFPFHPRGSASTFYLGRQQLRRLQIGQSADVIVYRRSRVSALLHLFAFPLVLFAPFFFLSTFWRLEKIFLSGHQWINGDVFTCLRPRTPPPPRPLHNNGTFNSLLTECFLPPATCRSLGPVGHWCHCWHWFLF